MFVLLSALGLAGCGQDSSGNSGGFSRETVTVGGGKFDCIFYGRYLNNGTMSCTQSGVADAKAENTGGFSRDTVAVNGDKFDCIFYGRYLNNGTMSCAPLSK